MRLHNTALIFAIAALALAAGAQSVTTTTVQGTVYLAGGAPASGSLQLSWPAFTTAAGQAIAAGHSNTTIGHDGFVSVNLAPNIGASPAGLYYTAIYHLADGSTSTEYWVVPAAASASLAQVRAQVMPAAQAVQAVSKGYVDQTIQELTQSLLTSSGGNLTGPLYLSADPSVPTQAATKRYVDSEFAQALPLGGGTLRGPVTATQIGAVFQADQASGADFGAKLQSCINRLDPTYGGVCDARNFSGALTMAANLNIAISNATIYLPCSTIATAASIVVPAGVRNITLHGCASRGTSAASGSQGGTVFLYSGASTLLQIGDPTYAADTNGFHLDNLVVNTTAASAATAQAIVLYRTQEASLSSLYLLGNSNQTALTLDGTGNYTGGTFQDLQISGFLTAVNAIGHQVSNPATTDWLNASTFLRLHIDCPTSSGNPIAATTGINLLSGDGNTFTGGDVENCSTALHLGPSAQNNTLIGLRNENSTTQIQADSGSSYNNWITGGTMFTGKLVDNGTRNSFLDTFHRSFNGISGDWYGSQQDATLTNHFRLGIGSGNERGLLNRYQTDSGYRWTTGLSDASAGAQFYQVLDELNNVYRLSIGQYNPGQSSSNNQTVLNSAGTGAILLNGSSNAGTGGVVFGSGGPSSSTVATVDKSGNANFTGTLQVGGVTQSTGTLTVRNNADSEVDYYLWPGATASQKGSFTYKDFNGASQWYLVKDASNNWAINSAIGGLDSFKAYQSTNSGDTYINAANSSGHIRLNYESGAGAETDIYSGSSSSLAAAFLNPTSIKLPGLAASSGHNCLQIDNSGYLSNAGQSCGTATTVPSAGLAFSDASVQTTSQQGALTGQANDATARASAANAQNAAATAQSSADAAQTTATAAQAAAAAAQAAAQTAEDDEDDAVDTANTAETMASSVQSIATAAQASAAAAQAAAGAALPANGAISTGSGSANYVAFPGAVGQGLTSPPGCDGSTDDTAAIQASLTAAAALPGSSIVFPARQCRINGTLTISGANNLTIEASGTKFTQTAIKTPLVHVTGSTNVTWNGGWLHGPNDYTGTRTNGILLNVDSTTGLKVQGVTFDGFGTAGVQIATSSDVLIQGNTFTGPGSPTIAAGGNYNFGINLTYAPSGQSGTGSKIRILDNSIEGAGTGILASDGWTDVTIQGNEIRNLAGQHGMYVDIGNNISIIGNVVENPVYDAIKLNPVVGGTNVKVSGNVLSASASTSNAGVNITAACSTGDMSRLECPAADGTTDGTELAVPTRWTQVSVKDNQVRGFLGYCVYAIQTDDLEISGNQCSGTKIGITAYDFTMGKVKNNSVANTQQAAIIVDPDSGATVDIQTNSIANSNLQLSGQAWLDSAIIVSPFQGGTSLTANLTGNTVVAGSGHPNYAVYCAGIACAGTFTSTNVFGSLGASDGRALLTAAAIRLAGRCGSPLTAGVTTAPSSLGNISNGTCATAISALNSKRYAPQVGAACKITGFTAYSYIAGHAADDGVVQMYQNGNLVSGATCTIATGNSCSWSGAALSVAATDVISFLITPDATATTLDSVGVTTFCQ